MIMVQASEPILKGDKPGVVSSKQPMIMVRGALTDTTFAGSNASLTQVVNQATTTTKLTASPTSPVYGQKVTLTATVAAAKPATAKPPIGSTVTFYDGSAPLGTAPIDKNGKAVLPISALAVASHTITARYNGTADFAGSTSGPLKLVVAQAKTKATLAASATSAYATQSVIFTATITVVSPGAGTPTGTVTFWDGTNSLGSVTLDSSGKAPPFSTSALSVGTHSITASYSGDTNFKTTISSKLSVRVSAVSHSLRAAALLSVLHEWQTSDK